jgi:hypothetical protein
VSFLIGDKETILDGFEVDSQPLPPLRVTISSRQIPVAGKLTDRSGQPAAGVNLVFVSSGMLSQAFAVTAADGSFQTTFREPGDYHVYPRKIRSNWDAWDELKSHENDYPIVHVNEGGNAPVTIVLK